MRLTKFNPETGEYEYKEKAKTLAEFRAQRKAVIQRLGKFEDRDEGEWKDRYNGKFANTHYECSVCGNGAPCKISYTSLMSPQIKQELSPFCPNCGARMKGENDEQR